MINRLAMTFFAVLLLPLAAFGEEVSFLFIGNSQTSAHGMISLFEGLASSGNQEVVVAQAIVGGATLQYHSQHEPTLEKIHQRNWDHVVLQEHSLAPVIPYLRDNIFYPAVATLDSIITNSGSHPTLFLHWAYPEPAGPYCYLIYCSRVFQDYFDMQQEMSSAYYPLADDLGLPLLRVGDMWATTLHHEPTLPLWGSDDLHTSYEGAYFTACLFYSYFFEESPVGLSFIGELDQDTALRYQLLAGTLSGAVEPSAPMVARFLPSYPNPFNPTTEIRFELFEPCKVKLTVYDVMGRQVREFYKGVILDAGLKRVTWDGRDDSRFAVPSGVYFLKLEVGTEQLSSKLTLVK